MYLRLMVFLVFLSGLLGCKSEYTRAVEAGLSSGLQNDSLIFGMKMGMTKDDFFRMCWDLNKARLIKEGPGNNFAKYIEPDSLLSDVTKKKEMLFYGIFDENRVMQGMDMIYNYVSWAPWNEDMSSLNLTKELVTFYEEHYLGNSFIEIELGLKEYKAYAKIDGNRQITIYPKSEKDVSVKIEDLNYKLKSQK